MSEAVKSILCVGVGGQGIIRASTIISTVFMQAGYDVKKSEVHGMAQRGGGVSSHIRYGKKVYSPLAKKGEVDILLSFEKLETLRYLDYLKPDATIIINDEEIYPPAVNLGEASYPHNAVELIRQSFRNVKLVSATRLAEDAGNKKAANTVMVGTFSLFSEMAPAIWETVLGTMFPAKLLPGNLKAFNLGRNA